MKAPSLSTTLLSLLLICFVFLMSAWSFTKSHTRPYYGSKTEGKPSPNPSPFQVRERVLLVGDAGLFGSAEPVLQAVAVRAKELPERSRVVFLGDNIYSKGYPLKDCCEDDVPVLDAQIQAITKSGARGFFIAGNHDWKGKNGGLESLKLQASYIKERSGGKALLRPPPGEMVATAPESFNYGNVRWIFLDTNIWLKSIRTADQLKEANSRLETLLSENGEDRLTIVVGHHPLATYGEHGGHLVLGHYLKPVPLISALYRKFGFFSQDMNSGVYKDMVAGLKKAMKKHPPLLVAAGHEHNLQVIQPEVHLYPILVSGAGAVARPVWHGPDTEFTVEELGFMEVNVLKNGGVELRAFTVPKEAHGPILIFSKWLKNPS